VSVSGFTLSGADAGNYVLQPTGLAADITPAQLAVSGVLANNKSYDGTMAAALTGSAGVKPLGNDAVTVGGAGIGNFSDKNVGTAKPVSVSGFTLSGVDAGNYVIVQPSGLAADITPASLTITAKDQSKSEAATFTFSGSEFMTTGLVGGERIAGVTLTSAGAPASAPVGSYSIKPGAAVAGAGFLASNYAINYTDGTMSVVAVPVAPAPAPAPAPSLPPPEVVNPLVTFSTLFTQAVAQQAEKNQTQANENLTDETQCRR
jgi:hypothetical protein